MAQWHPADDGLEIALPARENPPWRRWLGHALFGVWLPTTCVIGGYLLGGHVLALPPPRDAVLAAEVARERDPANPEWRVIHFVYAGCACSARVVEHLVARRPIPGVRERIVWVADASTVVGDRSRDAREAGFDVATISSGELEARYDVQSVPLLVVVDPTGHLRYAGGYTDRKQGPVIHDAAIVAKVVGGEHVASLPVFGCATSRQLQRQLDPMGLKYASEGP